MDPRTQDSSNKGSPKWLTIFLIIAFWIFLFYLSGMNTAHNRMDITYTNFKERVNAGGVSQVTIRGDEVKGTFTEPVVSGPKEQQIKYEEFETTIPPFADSQLLNLLEKNNVIINAESPKSPWFSTLLIGMIPWILIIAFFVYTSRRLRGLGGAGNDSGPFGFGKSRAKLYTKSNVNISFKDVAGLDNAKKELTEIIEFLKEPSRFRALGGKLPKGILLAGPPGTGKTLMARAAAGEANVPFYSISGSEFVEMFVGVGASRVRDMFNNAKKDAPCIIFIDEIDSIGRTRGAGGVGGGHDEREQTLNQILSEMDGFAPHESVIVMAATNRPDVLDAALVRPGRFDRRITLDLPQKRARLEILRIHARAVPMSEDVNLNGLADMTVGFSGAELENLVNEAALLAARKGKDRVEAEDFEQSRDKIIMGLIREEIISDEEKKAIAYHESGHALLAKLLPGVDPLQKVTIIPRGHALGATEQIPGEDRHNLSRSYLLNRIAILLGGRIAEMLVFKDITTGAGDDLKKANQIARRMVCQWGMSDRLGAATFQQGEEHPYLGYDMSGAREFSEHTARIIDEEVHRVIEEMEKKARDILELNLDKLDTLADALLEHETLDNADIDKLLNIHSKADGLKSVFRAKTLSK